MTFIVGDIQILVIFQFLGYLILGDISVFETVYSLWHIRYDVMAVLMKF